MSFPHFLVCFGFSSSIADLCYHSPFQIYIRRAFNMAIVKFHQQPDSKSFMKHPVLDGAWSFDLWRMNYIRWRRMHLTRYDLFLKLQVSRSCSVLNFKTSITSMKLKSFLCSWNSRAVIKCGELTNKNGELKWFNFSLLDLIFLDFCFVKTSYVFGFGDTLWISQNSFLHLSRARGYLGVMTIGISYVWFTTSSTLSPTPLSTSLTACFLLLLLVEIDESQSIIREILSNHWSHRDDNLSNERSIGSS
jgi:hypothetical protein